MIPITITLTNEQTLELTEEQVVDIEHQLLSRRQRRRANKRWEKYRNITSGTHIPKA